MRIDVPPGTFDLHHHVGALSGYGEPTDNELEQDVATRLAYMDEHGIEQCLLLPGEYAPTSVGSAASAANDRTAAYRLQAPDRFAATLATADPRTVDASLEEIDRVVAIHDVRGFVWHHHFIGTFINDPGMFRLIERIGEHGLPAFVHIIAGSFLESAWRLGVLADAFPDMEFVALDGFSSPDQAGSMIPFAQQHPNIVFDTGVAATVAHGMPAFIREIGAHRLLLGTDFYSSPRLFETPYALYELLNSGLEEQELAQVLGRNARLLLRLTA